MKGSANLRVYKYTAIEIEHDRALDGFYWTIEPLIIGNGYRSRKFLFKAKTVRDIKSYEADLTEAKGL